jgi:cbb3-type cytochrome oxidase subunit 3
MNVFNVIASTTTVLSFVAFLAILAWACRPGNATRFARAAEAPFALPDDLPVDGAADAGRRPS